MEISGVFPINRAARAQQGNTGLSIKATEVSSQPIMTIRCIMNTKRPNHPIIVMIKSDFLHFECSLLVGQECSTFLILFSLAFKFALGNKEVCYDKALISTSTVLH